MSALYNINEIISATGASAENISAKNISSISIDSREIEAGALYVAIKGERYEGHDFVESAIKNGAVAALVSQNFAKKLSGLPLIIVPDALAGLEDIARFARARTSAKIIAITGSAGKTSTKEIISNALSNFGKTHASIKSFNNHWGVPLTLARMAQDTEYGIFEIGMNHAGEITPLSRMVNPDIAVITNVAPAHLEQLGSLENIALAKAEIFEGLKKSGTAIINIDHQQSEILLNQAKQANIAKIITYGFANNADVQIANVKQNEQGMSAKIIWQNSAQELPLNIASFGRHKCANASVALIIANQLGLNIKQVAKYIASHKDGEGRGITHSLGNKSNPLILIDESYNANPLSMQMTLENFATLNAPNGNKILVLGDMLELGEMSQKLHIDLGQYIIRANPDKIFLIGNSMLSLAKNINSKKLLGHANDIIELEEIILNSLDFGDVIMVKGSNGIGLSLLVKKILQHFKMSKNKG